MADDASASALAARRKSSQGATTSEAPHGTHLISKQPADPNVPRWKVPAGGSVRGLRSSNSMLLLEGGQGHRLEQGAPQMQWLRRILRVCCELFNLPHNDAAIATVEGPLPSSMFESSFLEYKLPFARVNSLTMLALSVVFTPVWAGLSLAVRPRAMI